MKGTSVDSGRDQSTTHSPAGPACAARICSPFRRVCSILPMGGVLLRVGKPRSGRRGEPAGLCLDPAAAPDDRHIVVVILRALNWLPAAPPRQCAGSRRRGGTSSRYSSVRRLQRPRLPLPDRSRAAVRALTSPSLRTIARGLATVQGLPALPAP